MSQNLRGLYIQFEHDRPADWSFLAQWQPSVVRIMVPGNHTDPNSISTDRIQRLHDTTGARVLIRCWSVDDRRGDGNPGVYGELQANPHQCALTYHDFWRRFMDRLPANLRDQCWAGSINEPHPDIFQQTFEFSDELIDLGTRDGVAYGVFMFSVGTPPLPGENMPWGWQKFATLDDAIADGGHAAVVHEYMQPEGMYAVWTDEQGRERRDYGYLIGRHLASGLVRAPIIIGEWGIEGLLYNRHPDSAHGGHSGWLNFRALWGPERYADEYVECIRRAAPNVIAICPFGADIPDANQTWNSFDVMPAYGALLSRKELCARVGEAQPTPTRPETPGGAHVIHLPTTPNDGPTPQQPTAETPEPQPTPVDNWQRSMAYVRRWEGGWVDNPADYGKATMKGITLATFTQWRAAQGMGAPTKDDLRAISDDEVAAILYQWYWLPSGAGNFAYPRCLVIFDTATLFGVANTVWMRDEVADSALGILGLRLLSHLGQIEQDATQAQFWEGWKGRVLELRTLVRAALGLA